MDLSLKERDRVSVLRQVGEGWLAAAVGAERIGVTPRHFRRLRRKFEAEGGCGGDSRTAGAAVEPRAATRASGTGA